MLLLPPVLSEKLLVVQKQAAKENRTDISAIIFHNSHKLSTQHRASGSAALASVLHFAFIIYASREMAELAQDEDFRRNLV